MNRQITDTIMMIRPKNFGFNEETAADNAFQVDDGTLSKQQIKEKALNEFDLLVDLLRRKGINVIVFEDTDIPVKSDAVFPNNWISFHEEGWVITYPMFSANRRHERREDIVEEMTNMFNYDKRYSFEYYEEENLFLEGTGSLVLDRINKIAYASLSERTDIMILDKWAVLTGYKTCVFNGVDNNGIPIYHTNVLMSLGKDYVILCLEIIKDEDEQNELLKNFRRTGKELIEITYEQMESFAGNMLQVTNGTKDITVMSKQAFESLTDHQISKIQKHSEILSADIQIIERCGGGSVRCMMAEVFQPHLSS